MSKSQTIARLQALLSRMQLRAAEPRHVAVAHVATAPGPAEPEAFELPAASPPPVEVEMEAEVEMPTISPPPPVHAVAAPPPPPAPSPIFDLDEPVEELEATAARMVPSRPPPMTTDPDIVLEVEVQATTQDTVIAVPAPEPVVPAALESRERLVAAEPVADVSAAESPALDLPEPEPSPVIAVQVEEEIEEEAPASSRRPVAPPPEERLEEMAFGNVEPEPPRHTPPPESGRLLAAQEVEFDGDITGVRSNTTKSATPPAPTSLVPEATLAELSASDQVADLVGSPAAPAPTTFAFVLDLSLAL